MARHLCLILLLGLAACTARHITPMAAADLRHREPPYSAPPPGHPFHALELGVSPDAVRAQVGVPSAIHRYPTAWTFVPFYTGSGERRTVWSYAGSGRLIFVDHPRTGELELMRVEYDPREAGV